MRLLKLSVDGASLFADNKIELDFIATDRVLSDGDDSTLEYVHRVGAEKTIYSQNLLGLTGINASGKTTTLNILRFVLSYLAEPFQMRGFQSPSLRLGKLEDEITVCAVFWESNRFYLLESTLSHSLKARGISAYGGELTSDAFSFVDETLYELSPRGTTRRTLLSIEEFKRRAHVIKRRNGVPGQDGALSAAERTYLNDNTSIVISLTGRIGSSVETVNKRALPPLSMPTSVIQAFDGSVEYLKWDEDSAVFHLKFRGEAERVVSMEVASSILSRGTVYGSQLVDRAMDILKDGGYFIVDEIEESLNRSLVGVVFDLFASPVTNPHGAQLIFSTHYPELLDLIYRKDCVYVLTRNEEFKTEVVKYSDRVKRIENKKSEVLWSNLIRGSVPSYPDVQAMREYVRGAVNG